MREQKRKLVTASMIGYELRNVTGNPFVHIFGIGMPVFMMLLITRVAMSEGLDAEMERMVATTIFLGIGAIIPMATVLMGYAVIQAQDLEKGIPERMQLFGIRTAVTICSRAVSELIFLAAAFLIYFLAGIFLMELKVPAVSGALWYLVCMTAFSAICFVLAHAIATLVKRFSITYCLVMIIYFAFMMLGGSMGVSYENMPAAAQAAAKLLPVTYFNRDFYTIWVGEKYNFVPMLQSYLFLGAVAGILLFIAIKRSAGSGSGRAANLFR